MPLVNLPANPPTPAPGPKDGIPVITAPNYKHALVDGRQIDFASLLTYIEGSNWPVDYYSQVVGADEELSPFQPSQQAVYQQYAVIKDYILKLQGSLSISIDPDTGVASITGEATLFPFVRPNKGDPFIADIGDGRAGQFTVTNVEKKTILKATCFSISFELGRIMDAGLQQLLDSRVIKTGYFQRDYLLYGQNPVISSAELADRRTMADLERNLLGYWLGMFYSPRLKTILAPSQIAAAYDPFVVNAILQMYDSDQHPLIQHIKVLTCEGVPYFNQPDLYTAIITINESLLYSVFKHVQRLDVDQFTPNATFNGVRYSGVSFVIGPTDEDGNVDYDYDDDTGYEGEGLDDPHDMDADTASTLFTTLLAELSLDDAISGGLPPILPDAVAVHPVLIDSNYVFSQAFYDNASTGQSLLELMVRTYLQTSTVSRPMLFAFCQSVKSWGRLEQFFYTPILLALLKVAQRRL